MHSSVPTRIIQEDGDLKRKNKMIWFFEKRWSRHHSLSWKTMEKPGIDMV